MSGHPEEGARLLGAAERIAMSLDAPIFPRDQPILDRAFAALSKALGEQQLAAAKDAGRAWTVEKAIAQAKAVGEAVIQSSA